MLSPTPFSLVCALLLCLPFAVIYTVITPVTRTTIHNRVTAPIRTRVTATPTGITNKTVIIIKNTTTTPLPPRPLPPLPLLPHPLEDGDAYLLHQASMVNSNPMRPKKIAFMFLTTIPLPFAPLWEMYFNQTSTNLYNIYIHLDPSLPTSNFTGVFSNRVIPDTRPTRRYSPTLISAARRLLSHALLHDNRNYMFALLSPSCIPLHSFNFTYRILTKSEKSFVEILKNERGAWDRWAARGENVMVPEVPYEKFRIGSQFFAMTRKHAREVVKDDRLWNKFRLPCLSKYTCYPEEHYFATLMSMVDPGGCVHATLTHVEWKGRHDGHPRTYLKEEVGPDLILALRKKRPRYGDEGELGFNGSDSSVRERHRHPFLWARKFSPDSVQPLMDIASDIIFRD